MPELGHLYGALADDADRAPLSAPQALRRRADRRARARVLLAGAVTVVAVGAAGTAWGLLRSPSGGALPAVSVPASLSGSAVSPSGSAAPPPGSAASPTRPVASAAFVPPTSIPATALLALPAANRSDVADTDTGPVTLAAPCGAAVPGRDQVVVQRNRETHFHHAGDPGRTSAETITQNISVFKPGQAETFMTRLRAAATSCASEPVTAGRLRRVVVPLPDLGDEAFRVESTRPLLNPATDEPAGEATSFTTYIRIGPVVTVVDFSGSEGHTTPRAADVRIVTDAVIGPFRKWLTPS
ncbi:hypothetical protein Daura_36675 [Dactylosporangium aurantiacum]|uniref:Uncharacterized protein n=1 Tax=Dactylosporangium aurantiacum TaxID=35754 RepID=A0A9Q9MJS5_9ACTN|nr:hypothetical protein [Dactylosporangium aurantiacum]MDG6108886.1 hypothetical protein [Dactylosporangium aurantiacum]UWZ52182.1 hypothetical protein Daura_36675 [Dactylosporangium aurantiacum]